MRSRATVLRVPTVYTVYTQEQLNYLRAKRTLPRSLLTVKFNKRFETNKSIFAINALCKRKGWFTGRTGCFEKGIQPWNTGTKGICKPNSGCFRKGSRSKNWRPVGSERIDVDGYILVKVAEPNVWRFKHLIVWQSAYGKPKKRYVVRFKDNNKLNCAPDNLEAVSNAVNLYMNQHGYSTLPLKLKPTMKAIAEVKVKIFERLKRAHA